MDPQFTKAFPSITVYLEKLNETAEKLEQEHTMLMMQLADVLAMAQKMGTHEQVQNWAGPLSKLRSRVAEFMEDLDKHAKWEDEIVFPLARVYYGEDDMKQFEEMEEEHVLAEKCVDAFMQAAQRSEQQTLGAADVQAIVAHLIEAHKHLERHSRLEEELISALENRSNEFSGF